jgi:ribose/xylose/arabinose/galactoside ABC-type transport system permease subunit
LSSGNLNNIIVAALPLICAALGQQFALLVGEFDISLGASMTISVILASVVLSSYSAGSLLEAIVLLLAVGCAIGLLNATVTRVLKVNPVVGTIGTLSMLTGIAIVLRPKPAGSIAFQVTSDLTKGISFMPYAFIVLVILAVGLDFWLYRTGAGLTSRAVGLKTESAQRLGVHVNRIKTAGYLAAAIGAVAGGLFLATQIGIGSNDAGLSFALPTFAACFLGGATLGGGRGTFVGAVLGAIFLSVLTNTTQLLSISTAWGNVLQGVILIVAVTTYAVADRKAGR